MPLGWSFRHWAAALAGTALAAVVIAVPAGIIQTPLYHRMTPVTWWVAMSISFGIWPQFREAPCPAHGRLYS